MSDDPVRQKSILRQVLLWNLALFAGLGMAGWAADSSAYLNVEIREPMLADAPATAFAYVPLAGLSFPVAFDLGYDAATLGNVVSATKLETIRKEKRTLRNTHRYTSATVVPSFRTVAVIRRSLLDGLS